MPCIFYPFCVRSGFRCTSIPFLSHRIRLHDSRRFLERQPFLRFRASCLSWHTHQFRRICVFRRSNICHPILPGSVIRHIDAAHSTVHVGSVVVPIHTVPMSIYFAPQVIILHRTDPVWDTAFWLIRSGQILEASASIFYSLALASVSFVRFSNVPIFRWHFEVLVPKLRLVIHLSVA